MRFQSCYLLRVSQNQDKLLESLLKGSFALFVSFCIFLSSATLPQTWLTYDVGKVQSIHPLDAMLTTHWTLALQKDKSDKSDKSRFYVSREVVELCNLSRHSYSGFCVVFEKSGILSSQSHYSYIPYLPHFFCATKVSEYIRISSFEFLSLELTVNGKARLTLLEVWT